MNFSFFKNELYLNCNKYKFKNNKLSGKSIHSSAVLLSESNNISAVLRDYQSIRNERISNLEVVKYESRAPDLNVGVEGVFNESSMEESFSWFYDENGNKILFNKSVGLLDCVKYITIFLEKKYGVDSQTISQIKLSELIKPFEKNPEMTLLELYNHVGRTYNENKDLIVKEMESSVDLNKDDLILKSEVLKDKPLGELGEVTFNQGIVYLRELKWESIIHNVNVGIHVVPAVVNFIGFGFVLKQYMNHVHNQPYIHPVGSQLRIIEADLKRRRLGVFLFFGAPLILASLKLSSVSIGDMISLDVNKNFESTRESSNLNTSGIFLILSNLNKNIPSWLKVFLRLIMISVLILKLLGFSIFTDILLNSYNLKIYSIISCSFGISYQLLSIYLIHKFSTTKVNIPEVLPEFIIKWLKSLEMLSSDKNIVKNTKNSCYIDITIYITICVIISLILS